MPIEVSYGASAIGVLAHTVALNEAVDWLDDHRRALDVNRQFLADRLALRLPAVSYQPPEATFLAWLDCRRLGLGDDPAAVFLERGRVALNPGQSFGPGGAGHVRLNFATAQDILSEAVDRMGSCQSGRGAQRAGVRVSSVASGGQANRTGAYGDVPSPAETCIQDVCPPALCRDKPLTRRVSRSQLVTSAP